MDDNEYFEKTIKNIYDEILAYLEIVKDGEIFLIKNELVLKELLLRTMDIGYNRYKKRFATHPSRMKTAVSVLQFSADGLKLNEYVSIKEAERKLSLSHGLINYALKNHKKAGGFYWVKKSDYEKK